MENKRKIGLPKGMIFYKDPVVTVVPHLVQVAKNPLVNDIYGKVAGSVNTFGDVRAAAVLLVQFARVSVTPDVRNSLFGNVLGQINESRQKSGKEAMSVEDFARQLSKMTQHSQRVTYGIDNSGVKRSFKIEKGDGALLGAAYPQIKNVLNCEQNVR